MNVNIIKCKSQDKVNRKLVLIMLLWLNTAKSWMLAGASLHVLCSVRV